jgi:hypothetical protein
LQPNVCLFHRDFGYCLEIFFNLQIKHKQNFPTGIIVKEAKPGFIVKEAKPM